MDKTKKVVALIGIVITLIGAILGSGAVFDFSNTITIDDDSSTVINEGDTIIGVDKDDIKEAGIAIVCTIDPDLCD